jgi:hypothetical protein
MERKKSSGKPFQMRSGNSTPYPFLNAIGKGLKNMLPGSKGKAGAAATGGAGDMNTKIDEIHSALVGEEGENTMMTKNVASPLYHGDHQDPQVGLATKSSTEEKRHRHVLSNVNQGPPKD